MPRKHTFNPPAHHISTTSIAFQLRSSRIRHSSRRATQSNPQETSSSSSPPRTHLISFITPPPLNYSISPYARIPLPPQTSVQVILNPLLERGPACLIEYDIRTPSYSATCLRQYDPDAESMDWRFEPATFPSMDSLAIRMAPYDRPIVVFPGSENDGTVTVGDVLSAIHRAVSVMTREPEMHEGGTLWARDSWSRTTRRITNEGASHGWRWMGLTPSPTERDVWILLLD